MDDRRRDWSACCGCTASPTGSTLSDVTCVKAKITPLIAVKRDEHYPKWRDRFKEPGALPEDASALEAMKHALKTKAGRAAYALRKQTVEPVFGIIKSVMGFRQFLLRGLENVRNEWTLTRHSGVFLTLAV